MKDYIKILNEIIESYNSNEYPEYFQDDVYQIFKREGIIREYKAEPIVQCNDAIPIAWLEKWIAKLEFYYNSEVCETYALKFLISRYKDECERRNDE